MERTEPHGKDGADGLKKPPFKCCSCRSTIEHRCYMCLCGKCPHAKKVRPRYGGRDCSSDPRPSTATEQRGIQEPMAYTAKNGSSEVLNSPKETRGNQVDWADKAGLASAWGTSSENKPRDNALASGWGTSPSGNQEQREAGSASGWGTSPSKIQELKAAGSASAWGTSSENKPRGNASASGWGTIPSGNQELRAAGLASAWGTSSETKPRGNVLASGWGTGNQERKTAGSFSAWGASSENKPRGNVSASGWGTGNQERKAAVSASAWGTSSENKPRDNASASGWGTNLSGNQERRADRAGSKRATWGDRRHAAEPNSRNKEAMDNNAQDGFPTPILRTPQVEPHSRSPSHAGKRSRGDREMTTYSVEDASSEPVKMSRGDRERTTSRAEDASSEPVKLPKGSQEIVGKSTEDGSSRSVLVPPNVLSGPTQARSAEKELRGSSVSINLEGVARENKKVLDSAVASPRHLLTVVSEEQEVYCSPADESTWRGNFEIVSLSSKNEGFVAHPASKISAKAYELARKMSGNLKFEMHHCDSFLPEAFKTYCDANDIGLYFYPQKGNESSKKDYTALLRYLTGRQKMLRSKMGQTELLVFSSKLLCPTSQKDRSQYFLWGVFRKFCSDKYACTSGISPSPNLGPKTRLLVRSQARG